jgi:hypothetical protein
MTARAAAAGVVSRAPCLFDIAATWDTATCDDAPTCADGGVPDM